MSYLFPHEAATASPLGLRHSVASVTTVTSKVATAPAVAAAVAVAATVATIVVWAAF